MEAPLSDGSDESPPQSVRAPTLPSSASSPTLPSAASSPRSRQSAICAAEAAAALFTELSPDGTPRMFYADAIPLPPPHSAPLVLTVESAVEGAAEGENTERYTRTLRDRGWDYRVLGRGAPWEGVITKMYHYRDALRSEPAERLVFLTDSRDVVCQGTPDGAEEAFVELTARTGALMLVSMEMFCDGLPMTPMPHPDARRRHCVDLRPFWSARGFPTPYDGGIPRPFVNSGLVVGRAAALYAYVEYAIAQHKAGVTTRDQVTLGKWMNENPLLVAPDVDARLLHTSGSGVYNGHAHPSQATDGPNLGQLVWGRGPRFLHVPGLSVPRWPMQRLLYDAAMSVALAYSPLAAARAAQAQGTLPSDVPAEQFVSRDEAAGLTPPAQPWHRLAHGLWLCIAHKGGDASASRVFHNPPVPW